MNKPKAVLLSDVHYSVHTLLLADIATRQAIAKANVLNVPLIVCGDLHDTKANLRGECVAAMLNTFDLCQTPCYIIIGNHDLINERSSENSLEFLRDKALLIRTLTYVPEVGAYLVPYQNDVAVLRKIINTTKHRTLIMHQGIAGSDSGEYIQDKSALLPTDVAGFRVISGHYHKRQTIQLPADGVWDYVGNPYSLSYGEANDPPKGFQILKDDNSLVFVPTNLRRHAIINVDVDGPFPASNPGDLTWVKVTGTTDKLAKFDRKPWEGCRLELIPVTTTVDQTLKQTSQSQSEMFDSIIDSMTVTDSVRKNRLKQMWKDLVTEYK